MPNTNTGEKELDPKRDKIQQIFKFLEIADVSQWQGMNVFEAGDSDSLYGILLTAFEQVESHTIERIKNVLQNKKQKVYPCNNCYNRNQMSDKQCVNCESSRGFNSAIDVIISSLPSLNPTQEK